MDISAITSLLSLPVAVGAFLVSWLAYKRASDSFTVNLAVEIEVPKDFQSTPDDTRWVRIILRNRSLFAIHIEDLGMRVNDERFQFLTELLIDGNPEVPFSLPPKESSIIEIPDEDLEPAYSKPFQVFVDTGDGSSFQPSASETSKLTTYIQSKIGEQISLRKRALKK